MRFVQKQHGCDQLLGDTSAYDDRASFRMSFWLALKSLAALLHSENAGIGKAELKDITQYLSDGFSVFVGTDASTKDTWRLFGSMGVEASKRAAHSCTSLLKRLVQQVKDVCQRELTKLHMRDIVYHICSEKPFADWQLDTCEAFANARREDN